MATTSHTRRAALGAILIAPAVIAAPAVAGYSKVEAAFTEWKAVRHHLDHDDNDVTDAGHPMWDRLTGAERIIRESRETGARVAEIRLWVSVVNDLIYAAETDAVEREDVDWLLENANEPDDSTVMILRAIKALRA